MRERIAAVVLLAALLVAAVVCLHRGEAGGGGQRVSGADADQAREAEPSPASSAPAPVVARFRVEAGQFEGFRVVRSIPREPRALAFLFHGTGGGVEVAGGLEMIDLLNGLTDAGVGFIATVSTDREERVCWDIDDLDPGTNRDLARLIRLRDALIEEGAISARTPILGIGASSGGGFAATFGHSLSRIGWPVAAIAIHAHEIPGAILRDGGLRVPTFLVTCEHDGYVDRDEVRRGYEATTAAGAEIRWREMNERPLSPLQFARIPGVSAAGSQGAFEALVSAGVIDAAGRRVASLDQVAATFSTLPLPSEVAPFAGAIRYQLWVTFGVHSFSAYYRDEELTFLLGRLGVE